ncbi:MAG: 2-oxoglutarate dehydrogenase complex dihydrolipoyllysine-residue succinyltransferase [SAR324 cluster bacterium]|nr:2-oxoglutarate dehydrogenase complex dihydrolipoyllysine-residue succinyltransferase [SAR324 cluster bacterium]
MPVEIKIPSPGESITEVEIANWLKQDGEMVAVDEVLCEIETEKATLPLITEHAGKLKIMIPSGTPAKVGDIAAVIDTEASGSVTSPPVVPVSAAVGETLTPVEKSTYATGHPSVAAQKILAEKGLAPEAIQGSGKDGRITKADAQNASTPVIAPPQVSPTVATPKTATPSTSEILRESRKRMSPLRRKIAERLVSVKNETAMLTTFNEVDMSQIMRLRKTHNEAFQKRHGIKLGFMGFFVKAVTEGLKEFPDVNAMIDGDDVVYHNYVDMGIAVSGPKGLVVPVIRNADTMTIAEIEQKIVELGQKARDNRLSLDEMTGGTFSITNGGIFGSMLSTPIINPPQSAILGMHNIVDRPVAINGNVEIRPIMYVALSYDHRVIDGRESVSFLYRVKSYLEDPSRLLLGV